MPSFKDTVDARVPSESWSNHATGRWAGAPNTAAEYYALRYTDVCACEWFDMAHMMDAANAKSLLLQSIQDVADALLASAEKTELAAIAAETADLATIKARTSQDNRRRVLATLLAKWLDDEDLGTLQPMFYTLVRVHNAATGTAIPILEANLLDTFRSRCDLDAFTAGSTYV